MSLRSRTEMQLQTILRKLEPIKGFVYGEVTLDESPTGKTLTIQIRERRGSRGYCSGCGRKRPGYDRLRPRRFQYVPLWGIPVYLVYALRRVKCPQCGVTVEWVPWAEGKSRLTTSLKWFLAGWAKRLSWSETARAFRVPWESVYRSVRMAVDWGLKHRNLAGIEAIGVDEVAWRRGHKYLTLVYQIDREQRRLLWIGSDRKAKTLLRFFRMLGKERSAALAFICSDMWKPYLKVIAKKAPQALHVLDRYHIMAKMNKAIDEVRAAEVKELKAAGYEPILKHGRWCLLKRPANMTEAQTVKLQELLKHNLKSVKAYLMREDFQRFWDYKSPYYAATFLGEWCRRTGRTRLEPMKKIAKSLYDHGELILNWFLAGGTISAGMVEGFNNKVKLTMRKSYGFRSENAVETALYHNLGNLPEPNLTHRFC